MSDQTSCSSLKLSNKSTLQYLLNCSWKTPEWHLLCDPTPCENAKNARMSNDARTLKTLQNLTMGILKTLQNLTVRKIKPYRTLHSTSARLWSPWKQYNVIYGSSPIGYELLKKYHLCKLWVLLKKIAFNLLLCIMLIRAAASI